MVPTRPFDEPPAATAPGGAVVAVSTGVGVVGVDGGVLLGPGFGFVVCLALVGATEWPGLPGAVPVAVPVA